MALGDIVNELPGGAQNNSNDLQTQIQILKSIDASMKQLLSSGQRMSRDNATNSIPDYRSRNTFRGLSGRFGRSSYDDFEAAFKKELMDGFIGSGFGESVKAMFQELADDFGVSLQDLPKILGQSMGKTAMDLFKSSKLGKGITDKVQETLNRGAESIRNRYRQGRDDYYKQHPEAQRPTPVRDASEAQKQAADAARSTNKPVSTDISSRAQASKSLSQSAESATSSLDLSGLLNSADAASTFTEAATQMSAETAAASTNITAMGEALAGAGGGMAGLEAAMGPLTAVAPELAIALLAVEAASWALAPALDGMKKAADAVSKSANREYTSRAEYMKYAKERLANDIETMVRTPFQILEDAANKLYDAWDSQLRTITATQGYNKEEYSNLLGAFADRLRSEGLTKSITAADLATNLSNVLSAGLTGPIAEEFAYQATKLNAAVPTQDFFQYASQYGSLVANAMLQQGMTQSDAITYATEQLTQYASDILYASRNISGGVATGLQSAQTIFEQAVQISQAARTNDPSAISGVMAVVSAVTGAIAPDLASSMTDAIYRAATGGNSSEIVALRSLAGINASNTEFLKALAQDPQSVFVNLFEGLARQQNMSADAYMEVAEGLSSIFGISMDAFARVDFNYLAQSIAAMDTANDAIVDNLDLLISGQTTTNAEQLRAQQVNQYILEEGLSYVLDNEAGRAIQQHMWDEQIAQQLMEAKYGVELEGAALELLSGIHETVDKILSMTNPFRLLSKAFNAISTAAEVKAQKVDVERVLEAGRVGGSNKQALKNLSTRGKSLDLTPDLLTLMGSSSAYTAVSKSRKKISTALKLATDNSVYSLAYDIANRNAFTSSGRLSTRPSMQSPTSAYDWNTLSKSAAASLLNRDYAPTVSTGGMVPTAAAGTTQSAQQAAESASEKAANKAAEQATEKINKAFAYMTDYAKEKGEKSTFEDWQRRAKSMFGISNMEKTLSAAGLSEEEARSQFDQALTQAASEKKAQREVDEENFWKDSLSKMDKRTDLLAEVGETLARKLGSIQDRLKEFYDNWVSYYIRHTYYERAGMDYSKVSEIQSQEKNKTETAVYALADALTQNNVDLRDPAVQTNVLLAQVLKVLNTIAQQGSSGEKGTISLPDSIAGMALGLTIS